MPAKHKILITGSSGMLGIDLFSELDGDYDIYGADLVKRETSAVKRFIKCDITNEKRTLCVLSKIRPDLVIHTAAWTDVDGCESDNDKAYRINSFGAENIALGCKETGATLVYISTDFVFDGKKQRPYKETDRTNPLSVYGESKLLGENAVERILAGYFTVRTGWLYGKNGKNFVDTIIGNAGTKKELKVVNDQAGSPTYTKDLAKAIHKLLDIVFTKNEKRKTKYGIYHVSNSGTVSWFEYAKTILELTGSNTKVVPITSEKLNRPAKRPAMSVLDNSKFTGFTGYKMRHWKEALKEYISC